ncbi:helix-turn-helix domain-containing protein [Streptomyces sp. NPDC058657]|uniref:helix-turn-helix domain-containing protein n=1 Tax=unclassified Streptomyces TaxID=2593676 RepID=UPI0036587BD7
MARWKELPAGLGERECRLVGEIRRLKDHSGLSLAALGVRTPYSKSSWERYLNGKKPVPRQAVEALCAVAGEPGARLLVLWELADADGSGRSGRADGSRGRGADRPAGGAEGSDLPAGAAGGAHRPAGGAKGSDRSAGAAGGSDRSGTGEGPVAADGPGPVYVPLPTWRKWWWPYVLLGAGAVAGGAVVFLGVVALGTGSPRTGGTEEPTRRPPGAAGVEAGCLGVQCEGRTPTGMGCGQQGAATSLVDRYAREGQRLEIRWSEVCRAMWVRASHLKVGDKVVLYPALKDAGGAVAEDGEGDKSGGKVMRAKAEDVGDATGWVVTAMTAPRDPAGARVCLEPVARGVPECFDK